MISLVVSSVLISSGRDIECQFFYPEKLFNKLSNDSFNPSNPEPSEKECSQVIVGLMSSASFISYVIIFVLTNSHIQSKLDIYDKTTTSNITSEEKSLEKRNEVQIKENGKDIYGRDPKFESIIVTEDNNLDDNLDDNVSIIKGEEEFRSIILRTVFILFLCNVYGISIHVLGYLCIIITGSPSEKNWYKIPFFSSVTYFVGFLVFLCLILVSHLLQIIQHLSDQLYKKYLCGK